MTRKCVASWSLIRYACRLAGAFAVSNAAIIEEAGEQHVDIEDDLETRLSRHASHSNLDTASAQCRVSCAAEHVPAGDPE